MDEVSGALIAIALDIDGRFRAHVVHPRHFWSVLQAVCAYDRERDGCFGLLVAHPVAGTPLPVPKPSPKQTPAGSGWLAALRAFRADSRRLRLAFDALWKSDGARREDAWRHRYRLCHPHSARRLALFGDADGLHSSAGSKAI